MAFPYNENKLVKIKSNSSVYTGENNWKNNIARILKEQNRSNSELTLFNNLGRNLTVRDKVELLMDKDFPNISPDNAQPDVPIKGFLQGELMSKISGGIGMVSAVGNALGGSGGTSDTFQPWFVNVPTFKNSEVHGVKFNYTFNFKLGQYGLWNAKEEVVLPILNLLSPTLLREISAATIQAPYPTTIQLLADVIMDGLSSVFGEGALDSLKEGVSTFVSNLRSSWKEEGIEGAVNETLSSLGEALQNLIHKSFNEFTYDISFGNVMTFRKCLIPNATASFSKETDENGYPVSGSIDMEFHTMVPLSMSFAYPEQQAIRFGVDN